WAARLYEEVVAKYEGNPDFNDRAFYALGQLVQVRLEAKQPEKALPRLEDYLSRYNERSSREQEIFTTQMGTIGRLLVKNEQYLRAEKPLRRCRAIVETTEPDAWTTFNTQSRLGAALLGQKKYAEAEPYLLRGYEGMKQRKDKIPTQYRSYLADALERLV